MNFLNFLKSNQHFIRLEIPINNRKIYYYWFAQRTLIDEFIGYISISFEEGIVSKYTFFKNDSFLEPDWFALLYKVTLEEVNKKHRLKNLFK
ncbi:hypothetical protein HZF08_07800 [Paenibacillus sp. CGMCC 1.16610]|uniref:Uncharacterized protein n=1 Tax=Paenibacillus anseongense TaxID=2682845 RepID=A0ABW9UDA3_9BACL|nr:MULTISPECIES: hypothetical protein [Paenibacillus]MBA2938207.1 hypothetical protein [Paenibacillus sp. CGMCC 1.16610]MVQ37265.1 hypothetical protein [Paenibacillus anseongense]